VDFAWPRDIDFSDLYFGQVTAKLISFLRQTTAITLKTLNVRRIAHLVDTPACEHFVHLPRSSAISGVYDQYRTNSCVGDTLVFSD